MISSIHKYMLLNFFSDDVKEHWNKEELRYVDVHGSVSADFRGIEKFFRGWRAVITILFAVVLFGVILESHSSPIEIVFGLSIFALAYYIYYRLWLEEQKVFAFVLWLSANRHELQSGVTLIYDGCLISLQTKTRQFEACFSFGLITVRFPSRFLFLDKDHVIFMGIIYSLYTFLFGWWGFPWGPVFTIKAIIHNLVGGHKATIQALIQDLDKEAKRKK